MRQALAQTDGQFSGFEGILEGASNHIGIPIKANTAEGRLLARTVLRGYVTFLEESNNAIGAAFTTPDLIPRHVATAQMSAADQPKPIADFPLFHYWDTFEEFKLNAGEWKRDMAANARATTRLFMGLFGDITAGKVAEESFGAEFKEELLKLPRLYDKAKQWRGKPLKTVIRQAKANGAIDRLSPGTVNKHLCNMKEYFDYLQQKSKIPRDVHNSFAGQWIERKQGRAARADRNKWPEELERKLFTSPIYTGSQSIHRRTRPGPEIYRDALFWIPLWGRTCGARQDELCSARVGQIKFLRSEHRDIAYLDIAKGKDTGSIRYVPLHQLMLDLGFLEHRVYGRAADEPLFPELIPQGPEPRRSTAFTGRFTQYRRGADCYQSKVDFHSFRSNVETDLKNAEGIKEAWIDELIGHESIVRRSEGSRYTKEIYLPILKRSVDCVQFPIDFEHLRYKGQKGEPAPGAAVQIMRFVTLAEREMQKKATKRRHRS